MTNLTLFAQIIHTLDRFSFTKLVGEHQTDKHEKGFNIRPDMVTMLFCQFSKLNSLRDVCNEIKSASGNLNHLGVGRAPCKSSLSYQNKQRAKKRMSLQIMARRVPVDAFEGVSGFVSRNYFYKSTKYLIPFH